MTPAVTKRNESSERKVKRLHQPRMVLHLRPPLLDRCVSDVKPHMDRLASIRCDKRKQRVFSRIFRISRQQKIFRIGLKVHFGVAIRHCLDVMRATVRQMANDKITPTWRMVRAGLDKIHAHMKAKKTIKTVGAAITVQRNESGVLFSICVAGNELVCVIRENRSATIVLHMIKSSIGLFVPLPLNSNVQNALRILFTSDIDDSVNNTEYDNVARMLVPVHSVGAALVSNTVRSKCDLCGMVCPPGYGVLPAKCLHIFCVQCMQTEISKKNAGVVRCPRHVLARCRGQLTNIELNELKISLIRKTSVESSCEANGPHTPDQYEILQKLDNCLHVSNAVEFVCRLCSNLIAPLEGIVLRGCIHEFCLPCLAQYICRVDNISVTCPFKSSAYDCEEQLQQRDVRAIVPEFKFNDLLQKSMELDTSALVERCRQQPNPMESDDASFCCCGCLNLCDGNVGFSLEICGHTMCRTCRISAITNSSISRIACHIKCCPGYLLDVEVRCLLNRSQIRAYDAKLLSELNIMQAVSNDVSFECTICFCPCAIGDGIKLRDCLHVFCKECMVNLVQNRTECQIKCPFVNAELSGCDGIMEEREIRGILTADQFDTFMQRTHVLSLNMVPNAFPCRTTDCMGYWIIEPGDVEFNCEVCGIVNCLKCKTIHENLTCGQFEEIRSGKTALSQQYIQNMIAKGTAMMCPQCQAVITKSAGCDAMSCPFCKIEICWATKGLRWGPKGKNDISAGCRCRIGNRLCHPKCNNCH